LRQMRDLTREFAAEVNFRGKGWSALRLLPKPLIRYGGPGPGPIDGAIFGLVVTTDPQVLLVLEARPGADGPSSVYALRGKVKGVEVWSLPRRSAPERTADRPFHVHYLFRPGEPRK
jgi:hypothetical protein